jgi:hypothetical protein
VDSNFNKLLVESLLEADNRRPSEGDYAAIGKIALLQTSLEYQLEALVWYYMGDVDAGHIATASLGSQGKTEMLKTLVDWIEPDDGVADAINWAIKCFHDLRVKRNAIIHGYNFRADRRAKTLTIERRPRSLVFDAFEVFEISDNTLQNVCAEQEALSRYIWYTELLIKERPRSAIGPNLPPPTSPLRLPPKPASPEALNQLPFQAATSSRRQRQTLEVKEAKEAKRGRRGKKDPTR